MQLQFKTDIIPQNCVWCPTSNLHKKRELNKPAQTEVIYLLGSLFSLLFLYEKETIELSSNHSIPTNLTVSSLLFRGK